MTEDNGRGLNTKRDESFIIHIVKQRMSEFPTEPLGGGGGLRHGVLAPPFTFFSL